MKFGFILCAVFALWPVMGFLGAQGYAPMLGLLGVGALFYSRRKGPPPSYAWLILAFIVWSGVTELWAPNSRGFFSGDLLAGDFAIRSASLRILLAFVCAALLAKALLALKDGDADKPGIFKKIKIKCNKKISKKYI